MVPPNGIEPLHAGYGPAGLPLTYKGKGDKKWSAHRESNPEPEPWQGSMLPHALWAQRKWSSGEESNLRPPEPHSGAFPLRYRSVWSRWRESNSQAPVPETGGLPTSLHLDEWTPAPESNWRYSALQAGPLPLGPAGEWLTRKGSNPQPPESESGALPVELLVSGAEPVSRPSPLVCPMCRWRASTGRAGRSGTYAQVSVAIRPRPKW